MRTNPRLLAALAALALPACAASAPNDSDPADDPADLGEAQSAVVICNGVGPNGNNPYKWAYFGDLHLHTSYSLDAYSFGTRSDPANAYLFAKGAAAVDVGIGTNGPAGPTISQPRPLDFLAVTDHSEFLAVTRGCTVDPASGFYNTARCLQVRSQIPFIQDTVFAQMPGIVADLCGPGGNPLACAAQQRSAWVDLKTAATNANNPCSFTSFIAYEWSNVVPVTNPTTGVSGGATNHRNVIFATDTVPFAPLDSINYADPPALWTGLDNQCTGACEAVTIPHNTNLSSGVSLQVWNPTPAGVAQQQKYQVSAEIYQHKGSSECTYDPASGQNDANCQFEQVDPSRVVTPGTDNYLRNGLEKGLGYLLQHPLQGNPLKMGFVGATDDHNGAPGEVDDANYVGHVGRIDDTPLRRLQHDADFGPGAITGAWAEQNTRDSIFAAIKRRETFATSGPRMTVRFFQTTAANACVDPLFPQQIVSGGGVTMGGTFRSTNVVGTPKFAVQVLPDPVAQNLATGAAAVATIQHVQVIKAHAYLNAGTPVIVEDGPVDVVDPATGVFPPTGGCILWTEPTPTPLQVSFYYVRVLQEPTWRYSHYDCLANPGQAGCQPGGPLDVSIKERAWTSPIWYIP